MIALLDPSGALGIGKAGISDLAIGGRKISGSSLYVQHPSSLYFYQSSLMASPDISLMERYLKHPPREPQYRRGRRHEEFCTTLGREGCALSARDIAELFERRLGPLLG
jgi:lipoate-protein ligase A